MTSNRQKRIKAICLVGVIYGHFKEEFVESDDKKEFLYDRDQRHVNEKSTLKPEIEEICYKNGCIKIPDAFLDTYGNMFRTEEEITKNKKVRSRTEASERGGSVEDRDDVGDPGDHDYDACCATRTTFILSEELQNTMNETKFIIHFNTGKNRKYQLIPEGQCVPRFGSCSRCMMIKTLRFLLVYDPSNISGFTFDHFEIDTYCSCQGQLI